MALLTSLVSYFKFDESSGNAADTAGSNTLTNTNTVTYSAGLINNQATFAAASSQYFVKTTPSSIPTGDMSLSFWAKPASQPASGSDFDLIGVFDPSTNKRTFLLEYANNAGVAALEFITSANGTLGHTVSKNQTLTTGTRYHIAVVYTASTHTTEIFVNGASIGTGDTTDTSLFASGADLSVGASKNGAGTYVRFMDGSIDEMGLWGRVLTSAEVSQLYNSGAGLAYPFTLSSPSSSISPSPSASVSPSPSSSISQSPSSSVSASQSPSSSVSASPSASPSASASFSPSPSATSWVNETKHAATFVNVPRT